MKNKYVRLSLWVLPSQKTALHKLAKASGTTDSAALREIIKLALK